MSAASPNEVGTAEGTTFRPRDVKVVSDSRVRGAPHGGHRHMTTTDPLSLTEAKRLAPNADTILLRATRPADLETPIGAFLRLDDGVTPAYLLESVEGGERLGRDSFLGVGPRRLPEVRDGQAAIQTPPPAVPTDTPDLPLAAESAAGAAGRGGSAAAASSASSGTPGAAAGLRDDKIDTSLGRDAYIRAVEVAKDAIASGEAIQVVLARRQSFGLPLDPATGRTLEGVALYRALRRVNPSPYLFFVRTPSFEVVGASPELLLQVEGDKLTTHPLAGTRPPCA